MPGKRCSPSRVRIIPRRAPPTSKRATHFNSPTRITSAPRISTSTKPLPSRPAASGIRPHAGSGRSAIHRRCPARPGYQAIPNPCSKAAESTAQIPVPAPVAGEIVERLVGPGQLLQAGVDPVLHHFRHEHRLGARQRLPERSGRTCASATPSTSPPTRIPTCFTEKFPTSPPRSIPTTRTLQARIVTENPGKKLKKDMYVTATVQAGAIRECAHRSRRRRACATRKTSRSSTCRPASRINSRGAS